MTVRVRDALGNAIPGAQVILAVEPPQASDLVLVIVQPAPTRDNGVTWAKLRSNVPGPKTLTITVGTGAEAVVLDSRPVVRFGPPPQVVSAAVPPETLSGCVPVSFSLRHEGERRADLLIEVDPDGSGNFRPATQVEAISRKRGPAICVTAVRLKR